MKFISNYIEIIQRKVATICILRDFDTMRVLGAIPITFTTGLNRGCENI